MTFTTNGSAVIFDTSGTAVAFTVTPAVSGFTTSPTVTPGAHASTHGAGGADPITTLGTVTTTLGTVTTLVAGTATLTAASIGAASNAEIQFLDGVTSAIQTQINTKAPLASPTFTGTVTAPLVTISGGTATSLVLVTPTIGTATMTGGTATTLTASGEIHTGQSIFAAGSAAGPSIAPTGDTNTGIYFPAADSVAISTAGTAAVVVDASGRVIVGDTASVNGYKIQAATTDGAGISTQRYSNDAGGTFQRWEKSRGAMGANTTVQSGDSIALFDFRAADGSGYIRAAAIEAAIDGTPGTNDMPGRLIFYTTADGAATVTEAMRINNGQELLIGYTADNGAYKLQVNSQIFATSATVATSDGRFKKEVNDLADGWNIVKVLRPVTFKWKDQQPVLDKAGNVVREAHSFPNGTHVGFIAQEVKAALDDRLWIDNLIKKNKRPEVVAEDGTIAPEEPFLGIAEGNLIPILTSALQTAMARIEALEARLDAAGL